MGTQNHKNKKKKKRANETDKQTRDALSMWRPLSLSFISGVQKSNGLSFSTSCLELWVYVLNWAHCLQGFSRSVLWYKYHEIAYCLFLRRMPNGAMMRCVWVGEGASDSLTMGHEVSWAFWRVEPSKAHLPRWTLKACVFLDPFPSRLLLLLAIGSGQCSKIAN